MVNDYFFWLVLGSLVFFHIALYFLKKITGLRWTQLSGSVMLSSFSKEFGLTLAKAQHIYWKRYRFFIMLAFVGWVLSFIIGIVEAVQ